MFVQHGSFRESDGINTREHLVLFRASPVSTGAGEQLECLDDTGFHQVRASTEVGKFTLPIERNRFALASVFFTEFYLVRFILFFQEGNGFVWGECELFQFCIFLDDFLHLGFDFPQFFCGKRFFYIEIIVETAVDCRANRKLCVWIQPLNRLSEDMRSRVPEGFLAIWVIEGADFKGAVFGNRGTQVTDFAVNLDAASSLIQSHADSFYNFCGRLTRGKFPETAVFQLQLTHD